MLTRLKVSGFKNLVDVDVRFGPFTCIAGGNGVGKSNLFDAIRFLSALADMALVNAANSIRNRDRSTTDILSLFHRAGDVSAPEMSLSAEMIVPESGVDDLGQEAKASVTFLRYSIVLAPRIDPDLKAVIGLEVLKEELTPIMPGEAADHLLFPHSQKWRKSVVKGRRTTPFISTEHEGAARAVVLHQDGGNSRPLSRVAGNLPRTVLSVANAADSPTALLARREMQSWRLLQLEPSALRRPDNLSSPSRLGAEGTHLAATLYRLGRMEMAHENNGSSDADPNVYTQVANRISQVVEDVRHVWVKVDDKRETLTLKLRDRSGATHEARELSDGTLRFLALAVVERDPDAPRLLCLEEPENGIHPYHITAMLKLLKDMATNPGVAVDEDNPLRQVVINTHSPSVISQVPADSLIVADLREMMRDRRRFKGAAFSALADTWRQKAPEAGYALSRGKLLAYLNPIGVAAVQNSDNVAYEGPATNGTGSENKMRVIDREDLQFMIPFDVVNE